MVICTVEVNEKAPQTIVIGRRGTYNTQEIVFDISYLISAYGAGTAVLAVKRSQDSSAYPTVVTQEDTTLTWTVSETDTYYVGAGECQLMWYVDGGLAKTIIYPLVVMRDILSTSEEAPDAYQTWVDDLTAIGAETLENAQNAAQSASDAESAKDDAVTAKEASENAQEAAEEAQQAAETAVTHYPKIVNNYWYVWANGEWVNTGVKAEGVDGRGIVSVTGQKTSTVENVDTYTMTVAYTSGNPDTFTFTVTNGVDGYSPVVTITAITGGHRVTITDETHPTGQSFDVMNGEDSAVLSVAGKTGNVTLNANDVAFFESGTYDDGTVGKELSDQKNAIDKKAPVIINTASGDIATFADGADGMPMKALVATIEPVQDLHGYDHPWPGGSGKNLLVQNLQIIKTANPSGTWSENVYSYGGLTFTVNVDTAGNVESIKILGTLNSSDVFFYFFRTSQGVTLNAGTYICSGYGSSYIMRIGKGNSTSDTIVARVAPNGSFTFDEEYVCSVACRFQNLSGTTIDETIYPMIRLSSVSDATFEPYSNICPFTGWTGLTGARTGKNVFLFNLNTLKSANSAGTWTGNVYSYQGLTYTVGADESGNVTQIGVSGTLTAADHFFYVGGRGQSARTHLMKSGEYIATGYSAPYKLRVGKGVESTYIGTFDAGSTIELNGDVFEFGLRIQGASGQEVNTTLYPMLRLATDTDSAYEPPYSDTISVNWQSQAGTVYGGHVDIISGQMVVDHGIGTADASSSWGYSSGSQRFYVNQDGMVLEAANVAFDGLCDMFAPHPGGSAIADNSISYFGTSSARVCFKHTESASVEDWVAFLGNRTITYTYPLATPIEYQLTPQEVTTLLGNNVVYTDVGPVTVEYPADTGIVVSQQKNAIDQLEDQVVTDVTVTGTIVTITAEANKRYLCGTVASIDVTPCVSGAFDLIFTSGSTAAVLTIPNTVKWQDSSFDPTALETDTIYEISVADGVLGLVASWT